MTSLLPLSRTAPSLSPPASRSRGPVPQSQCHPTFRNRHFCQSVQAEERDGLFRAPLLGLRAHGCIQIYRCRVSTVRERSPFKRPQEAYASSLDMESDWASVDRGLEGGQLSVLSQGTTREGERTRRSGSRVRRSTSWPVPDWKGPDARLSRRRLHPWPAPPPHTARANSTDGWARAARLAQPTALSSSWTCPA